MTKFLPGRLRCWWRCRTRAQLTMTPVLLETCLSTVWRCYYEGYQCIGKCGLNPRRHERLEGTLSINAYHCKKSLVESWNVKSCSRSTARSPGEIGDCWHVRDMLLVVWPPRKLNSKTHFRFLASMSWAFVMSFLDPGYSWVYTLIRRSGGQSMGPSPNVRFCYYFFVNSPMCSSCL